ncbi:MAG: prepilin peptidase [Candidatus Omnitrophota bacterium]|nr:prepilin peptidase [Candidatus Omnitrophota bacterium]MDZ4242400.1 prepilin peptidase [Candidatus Omnitrophota bacterium]
MTEPQIWGGLFFILGAIIGSFLNVCIARMPLDQSIVWPGSHCFKCRKPVLWYDNVPILSWFILGGKCRFCKERFSFRYPLVEFVTACGFLGFYLAFGLTPLLGAYLVMLGCFIIATFVDWEHKIIPDQISVGGMFAGLALSAVIPGLHSASFYLISAGRIFMWAVVGICLAAYLASLYYHRATLSKEDMDGEKNFMLLLGIFLGLEGALAFATNVAKDRAGDGIWPYLLSLDASLIGALVGGGLIYFLGLLGELMFKKEAMGGGDVKLLAMMGAFLGWKLALLTFFLAPFFGAVWGIEEKIRTKESVIAYGPFLVLAAMISLFMGERIVNWALSGYAIF